MPDERLTIRHDAGGTPEPYVAGTLLAVAQGARRSSGSRAGWTRCCWILRSAMRTNRLGKTAVEVTELGFGGGPLGGLFEPLDDEGATAALAGGLGQRIRYFDTAPHYGIGHSERRFGEVLGQARESTPCRRRSAGCSSRRTRRAARTRTSRCPRPTAGCGTSPATVCVRSVEDSLGPPGPGPCRRAVPPRRRGPFRAALRDGYPAFAELRSEGVVGAIGAGMYHPGS